ncbi:putative spore germination protein GerPB [Bacillus sp. THAF10]|uniref:spore germination protein GerPB n=1 Tax=Bacillus sp. THAF10 TaxID=2587848 RepID=UPI00126873F3|nr:spore germination protein GerPB [Bacillus sp. THAF10]QFT88315.1 putative spore germination protein GerPB [Bacillus sp. THAF10]
MTTNFFINQSIVIHQVKIGGISNSSVFQIGSAGMIKSLSNLYNTGDFTGPGPDSSAEIALLSSQEAQGSVPLETGAFVPLKGSTN